tara:strand:+ start:1448 stop:1657 length:210 start_codon:yes stop_codon:yes gene_type:complete
MARVRFGDQSFPQVSRVAVGGAATLRNLADVDTDTVGLGEGYVMVYNATTEKFQTTNVLNNVTVNGGSF